MSSLITSPAIVIPAYQPDHQLLILVQGLRQRRPEQHIIVVNDGSDSTRHTIFSELIKYEVDLLHHPFNLGKGQALKTAFNHYLTISSNSPVGVVTADADGQHSVDDILSVLDALVERPDLLHLGVRNFTLEHIPWRSKIGNELTGFIFRNISTSSLYDTQTGLRAIPSSLIPRVIGSKLKGYELELEMLLLAAESQIQINQIPIKTIYINSNSASHFNPWIDSFKIYFVFMRFSSFSFFCALLDIFIFICSYLLLHQVWVSVFLGRAIAAPLNFKWNRRLIFKLKSKRSSKSTAIKYGLFAAFIATFSYILIIGLTALGFNVISSKMIAEIVIFTTTFSLQQFIKRLDQI